MLKTTVTNKQEVSFFTRLLKSTEKQRHELKKFILIMDKKFCQTEILQVKGLMCQMKPRVEILRTLVRQRKAYMSQMTMLVNISARQTEEKQQNHQTTRYTLRIP